MCMRNLTWGLHTSSAEDLIVCGSKELSLRAFEQDDDYIVCMGCARALT